MPNWCYNRVTVISRHITVDDADHAPAHGTTADADGLNAAGPGDPGPVAPVRHPLVEFAALCDLRGDQSGHYNTDGPLSFGGVVPIPAELFEAMTPHTDNTAERRAELVRRHGSSTCYEFCCTRWGCKWDARSVDCSNAADEDGGELEYSFDTPWGPPTAWAQAASTRFPTLNIELWYEETGSDFAGTVNYVDGAILSEEEWQPSQRMWEDEVVESGALEPANPYGIVSTVVDAYDASSDAEQEDGQLYRLYQRPRDDLEAAITEAVDISDILDGSWNCGNVDGAPRWSLALVSATKLVWSPERHRSSFDDIGEGLKTAVRTAMLCSSRFTVGQTLVPPEIWLKIFQNLRAVDYYPWSETDPFEHLDL